MGRLALRAGGDEGAGLEEEREGVGVGQEACPEGENIDGNSELWGPRLGMGADEGVVEEYVFMVVGDLGEEEMGVGEVAGGDGEEAAEEADVEEEEAGGGEMGLDLLDLAHVDVGAFSEEFVETGGQDCCGHMNARWIRQSQFGLQVSFLILD